MKKIINKLFNNAIEGVDVYHHNGSFWLIFTDRKEWVIELDKSGKLWYRYQFFQNLFNYVSLDVIENQHYITEWVEDTIQNGVKKTETEYLKWSPVVEDTIQNGVMSTSKFLFHYYNSVEDTIRNGVMSTGTGSKNRDWWVEDTIKNGVKNTSFWTTPKKNIVGNTIKNGVKTTQISTAIHRNSKVEEIIQSGVII